MWSKKIIISVLQLTLEDMLKLLDNKFASAWKLLKTSFEIIFTFIISDFRHFKQNSS